MRHLESTLIPFRAPSASLVFILFPRILYSKRCVLSSPFSYPGHNLTDGICQAGSPSSNAWFSPGKGRCLPQASHQPQERYPLFSGNGRQLHSWRASVNDSQQSPLTSSNVFSFSSFSSGVYGGHHQSRLLKHRILAGACRRSTQSSGPRKGVTRASCPLDTG